MTKRDVVTLAAKILGVYSAVAFIFFIPQMIGLFAFSSSAGGAGFGTWFLIVLDVALYGLIAWYLIARSDVIGSWLYPEDEPQVAVFTLDKDILLQIAIMGIGVYLLARGITEFPGTILSIYWHARYAGPEGLVDAWTAVLRVVLEVGVGFYLVVGTRGLMRVIEHLRRA
jgi:hypothetical protein